MYILGIRSVTQCVDSVGERELKVLGPADIPDAHRVVRGSGLSPI